MFVASSREVAGLKVGVLLGFTEFYRVLPSFTEFYQVLPSFTGFYRVLLGFTEFYLIFVWLYRVFLVLFSVFFGRDSVTLAATCVRRRDCACRPLLSRPLIRLFLLSFDCSSFVFCCSLLVAISSTRRQRRPLLVFCKKLFHLCCTWFLLALLGFTRFYLVLLGFTRLFRF